MEHRRCQKDIGPSTAGNILNKFESFMYKTRQVVIFWYGEFSHQLEFVRCQGAPYKQRSSAQIKWTWYKFKFASKRSLGSSFFLRRSAGEVVDAHVICDGVIWKSNMKCCMMSPPLCLRGFNFLCFQLSCSSMCGRSYTCI